MLTVPACDFGPAAAEDVLARAGPAAAVAAVHADAVDSEARFPREAVEALRQARLLGAMVPVALGGEGADVRMMAQVCGRLGGACASTAMIFAMHQIKVACLAEHHEPGSWPQGFLREVAGRQLLLASSTTEGTGGGDVRSSAAPILRDGDFVTLERAATVMSYGAEADAIVTTARRSPEAAPSDQVLAVFLAADCRLERTGGWQTLGMRGTCSAGFALKARGRAEQVLERPYADIHTQTMTPVAHLLWSAVWAGIAAGAVERTRLFLRRAARSGSLPPASAHFVRAAGQLRTLRALIAEAMGAYEAARGDPARLQAFDFQTAATLLKVEVSELAVACVLSAMRACGLSGYRTDGPASQGRALRDILSAPVMINNDRILAGLGASALLAETSASLFA